MTDLKLEELMDELSSLIDGEVLTDKTNRILYSTDASIYQIEPLGVVMPKNKSDVKQAVAYASDNGLSIIPRGAGSGLSGQTLGQGIVIDFTKYMDRITEINLEESYVRLEPGVTLGVLNQTLSRDNKFLPPDPSSGDYCTLGGMLGNNASGGHSVKYGSTIDYVLELEVVLANGEEIKVENLEIGSQQFKARMNQSNKVGDIYQQIFKLVKENKELITEQIPEARKNCSGYRLDEVLADQHFNLAKLLVGSEGTLAVITEAKLRIAELPSEQAIALLYFDDLDKAGRAVSKVLELDPSAIEIMNHGFLELVRKNHADIDQRLPDDLKTALLIEFDGDSRAEIEEKILQTEELVCDELDLAFGIDTAYEEAQQEQLWSIRKSAVPILNKLEGPKRITGFVEDVAVAPAKLPDYIRRFKEIMDKYGVEAIIYGHAGHGNTHPRPLLNLKREEDIAKMEAIAQDVYELVDELNGTISGEHGDGLLRTDFIPEIYGPMYDLFQKTKEIFDPEYILNPGKIVTDTTDLLTKNLRYGADYRTIGVESDLEFATEYQKEVEKCHGCSKCRSVVGTDMCPVFKALGEEKAAPRAKANILRGLISGRLDYNEYLKSQAFQEVFDLCLNCKNCYLECSSEVNIPKLIMEARIQHYRQTGQPLVNRVLGASEVLGKLGSITPKLTNAFLGTTPLRGLLEKTAGIAKERSLPEFAAETFQEWFTGRENKADKKVAYFVGCSTDYYHPEVGKGLVQLLEAAGYQVIIPDQKCCSVASLNYGNLEDARKNINYNLESLAEVVDEGYDIVADCPSCSLMLKEEQLDVVDTKEARLVADNTYHITEYLLNLKAENELELDFKPNEIEFLYHTPCHLKAQGLTGSTERLLDLIPELEITELDAGCCGIAGTFGLKEDKYSLSMKIGKNLFNKVESSTLEKVLTDCDACRMQLEEGTGKAVRHPVEILAENLSD